MKIDQTEILWSSDCLLLHPTLPLPVLFFPLSAFSLFLSYNLFFSCKSCRFSMLLMKLMNSEELILAFIVVSFGFRVPVLVRFLKEWRIFVFLGMCSVDFFSPQNYNILPIYHFGHISSWQKKFKSFIDKFHVLSRCLWGFLSVLVCWLLKFLQTYVVLFVFVLQCQIMLHVFALLFIKLWFIFIYLQKIVHRYFRYFLQLMGREGAS